MNNQENNKDQKSTFQKGHKAGEQGQKNAADAQKVGIRHETGKPADAAKDGRQSSDKRAN